MAANHHNASGAGGGSSIPGRESLLAAASRAADEVVADLIDLVSIPSISSQPEHADQVRASADRVASLFAEAGCPDVRVVDAGGQPAVIARYPAPQGQPTVCLYAHHDVQPTGALDEWTSPPFEATERDGRLYGRGTADDKGGIAVHLAALRAFGGRPPVGVTVFVEGEEEVGSPTLARLLTEQAEALRADVYVIADSINWTPETPAVTTTLRGIVDCVVEVRTLDHGLHSGEFGGVVPDALSALMRLLASLHDDEGNVAIAGLGRGKAAEVDYPDARLEAETGKLPGVQFIGHGAVADRLWMAPAVTVIGIDAPRIAEASNTLTPVASAKVSLRVAPGDDARQAEAALIRHLETHAPWGAQVRVTPGEMGQPGVVPLVGRLAAVVSDAYTQAFGQPPVEVGCGGSIPMVHDFMQAFGQAQVVVTAVADPESRIHSVDESLHLGNFARACVAEALLLAGLADSAR